MTTASLLLSPSDAERAFITGENNPSWKPRNGTLVAPVPVVGAREVLRHLGLADSIAPFFEFVNARWTCGDTAHTLVVATDFLDALSEYLTASDDDGAFDVKWPEVLQIRFWTLVGTAGLLDIEAA